MLKHFGEWIIIAMLSVASCTATLIAETRGLTADASTVAMVTACLSP